MSGESSPELKTEIGHVLLIDIVGYSKLLITEQGELLETLKQLVQETEPVRLARSERDLIRLPTGDGMALVFRNNAEAPLDCALQLGAAVRQHPELRLRMGIHSGPIREVRDVNERINLAGAGIDVGQRVMDCGDAGHILVSKRVADDFAPYPRWHAQLHDLGETEVKHGARVHLFNLCSEEAGNADRPSKLRETGIATSALGSGWNWQLLGLAVAVLLSLGGFAWWFAAARSSQPAPQPSVAPVSLAIPGKSIAVLPFDNLSTDPENAFFADGVQDEILTNLAKIADLKVISRSSVMHYKRGVERNLRQIGEELNVAHLLEGNVQRAPNRIRVNAQLIDARNNAHLWGQTYDRELSDIFAIQSEIAKAIAEQLHARLSPTEKSAIERPPTGDINAFDLYTRAKNSYLIGFGGSSGIALLEQAADLLNQAVARDPSFFPAYCQLSRTQMAIYLLYDHSSARLAQAEAALQDAVRLRPEAAETHLARAYNLYSGYLDYDGAMAELEIARQTLPNDPQVFDLAGYIQRRQGRWEESNRNLERATELDPRNILTLQQTAGSYLMFRRYDDARSLFARILAFLPNDPTTRVQLAFTKFDAQADTRPLHEMVETIRKSDAAAVQTIAEYWLVCALAERDGAAATDALAATQKNPSIALSPLENLNFSHLFLEAVIARMSGDETKAQAALIAARREQEAIVQAQPNFGPALSVLALIDAGLGRKEEALREGRRAVELLPAEKDAMGGPAQVKYLAMIAAWVGDKDLACDQLASAVRLPSTVSYGELSLLPFWDPLRDDPRFKKIVADLAPPETKR
ncbi:MAG: hypothetical protein ABIU29_03520 [Chthoniobacterales bacterium]